MGKNDIDKNPDEIRFYHGGFPGLVPGKEILPYRKTSISLRGGYNSFDPKRIFVTTSLDLATAYALHFARVAPKLLPSYRGPAQGSVYEVKVTGKMWVDEDYEELAPLRGGAFSYSVVVPPRITDVIDTLPEDEPREYRLFAPFQTWFSPDGEIYPLWTDDGYLMPNAQQTKRRITVDHLERVLKLGPFPGQQALIDRGLYVQ